MSDLNQAEPFYQEPISLSGDVFRLLEILPGRPSEPIQCNLIHCSQGTAQYSCLSYMRGDPLPLRAILINQKRFLVRQNLFAFLGAARAKKMRQLFWIDAVCIDQENLKERNHQVQQMSRIYKEAQEVIIWPGILPDLGRRYLLAYHVLKGLATRNARDETRRLAKVPPGMGNLLIGIGEPAYWARTWILQEIFLAQTPKLMIGSRLVDFEHFATFYTFFKDVTRLSLPAFLYDVCKDRINVPSNNRQSPASRFRSSHDCLRLSAYSKCSDKRDRIYGVMGLCPQLSALPVSYEIGMDELIMVVLLHLRPQLFQDLLRTRDHL